MVLKSTLNAALAVVFPLSTGVGVRAASSDFNQTCTLITQSISSASNVYWPGSSQYSKDISHWASSSTQQSACTVEPSTAEDIGVILQILGNASIPFAVKGGGHATNPNFSSTPGVHIAMSRFSGVNYDATAGTADVGAGLAWQDVYAALEPYGVNIPGGRVGDVGVAGFTLGGGYSWQANQYGLTIDNVVAFELVLPNGTVTSVTASNTDLFFALKGGMNNFGIVTQFTFKAYPQGQIWGGGITYTSDQFSAVNAATANFAQNSTDPKAGAVATYNYAPGQPSITVFLFYDGPTLPTGTFTDFLTIPSSTQDLSTRSFLSFIQSAAEPSTASTRVIFNAVVFTATTEGILDAILNETLFWGQELTQKSGTFISYDAEPFLSTLFTHNPDGVPTAYPPSRDRALFPLSIDYEYTNSAFDEDFYNVAKQSAAYLESVAETQGQAVDGASVYGNYAIFDTPVENIYGGNLDRLKGIREEVDPKGVMALAGGFKI